MTSNEITQYQPAQTALSLPEQWQFAETVAGSSILPRAYREDPGAVLVAVNLGSAMGLTPAEALYRIHVIEGKPSASAELITSNVRRAGHRLRIKGDAQSAVVQIVRADDPDWTYEVTWTMADAQRAGLTGKSVWKAYPAAMLRARAITECARQACPEALYGVTYTEEEARESVDVEPAERPKRESAASLLGGPRNDLQRGPDRIVPEVPAEDPTPVIDRPAMGTGPDGPSAQQITAVYAGLSGLGYDRAAAKEVAGQLIKREISSMNELTRAEASLVLDRIAERKAALPQAENEAFPNDEYSDQLPVGGAA